MAASIRNLSACILLAIGALTAVIIVYSGDGRSGLENPVVGQESSAVAADKPEAVPEQPDVAQRPTAVMPEQRQVAQHGPILLPVNPPYLNSLIETQPVKSAIEPAEDEAWQDREETEQTKPDVAEKEQPAEEPLTELLALRQHFSESKQPPEEQPPEEEVREEEPVEEQPAEEPPPEEESAKEELAEEEDLIQESEPAGEEQPSETADENPQEAASQATPPETSPPPQPKPELTPALAALRDRVRRTVAFHRGQALSASQNTATEVMHACLAFGCNTEIYRSGSPSSRETGQKLNGITCLCWNYPCAGYELLGLAEGHIAARIGYGRQEHPSQLLAVLALSGVKATYPVRVGDDVRTVADLVEYEKLSCRSGADQSLKLIGLSFYAADEPTWENSLGQQWSIERIIKSELDQPILGAACGGTYRLAGLGYALARRERHGKPLEGQFARARKLIEEYHDYALKLQNSDGSWGPGFLASRGTSRNPATQLRSTGHVLEWLAISLPEDRLDDPRVVRSVEYVERLLSGQRYHRRTGSLSTRELGSVMHALHALAVYDERLFKPRTPKPPAPGEAKVAHKASS
jgi:hypothetical protein